MYKIEETVYVIINLRDLQFKNKQLFRDYFLDNWF